MRTATARTHTSRFFRLVAAFTITGCVSTPPKCYSPCGERGACSQVGSGCAVVSETDCQKSLICRETASCHFCGNGAGCACAPGVGDTCCAPQNASECAMSEGCTVHGLCSFVPGVCVAATGGDCANSRDCKDRGFCVPGGSLGCLGGGFIEDVQDIQKLSDTTDSPEDVSQTE